MKKYIDILLSAVALTLACVFVFSSCSLTDSSSGETTTEYSTSVTPLPDNSAAVVNYYNLILNKSVDGMPAVSWKKKYSVSDGSIKFTRQGSDETDDYTSSLEAVAPQIKKLIVNGDFPGATSGSCDYGEALTDTVLRTFSKGEVTQAVCKENEGEYDITLYFYEVPETSGDKDASVPDVETDAKTADSVFGSAKKSDVLTECEKMKDYLTVSDYTAKYYNCSITAVVDRLTNQVSKITYDKYTDITGQVEGVGTLADFGKMDAKFRVKTETTFEFDWSVPETDE